MTPPVSLEAQTKTSYIPRIFQPGRYVPLWLSLFVESLRQRFIVFLGQLKRPFVLALPGSVDDALNRLIAIARSYPDEIQTSSLIDKLIRAVLDDAQQRESLLKCRDQDAQCLLDLFLFRLNNGLTTLNRPQLQTITRKLAVASKIYPRYYYLANLVVSSAVECSGGCANVHKGEWNGQPIGAKVVRIYQITGPAISFEDFMNEAFLWSQCRHHQNILPFYGIHQIDNQIYLISPWMKNGDITHYLKHNRTSTRLNFVTDIARGVNHLHENGIVHRDLKGRNIFVDDKCCAVLADFGSSFDIDDAPPLPSLYRGGTVRWQGPELFKSGSSESLPESEGQLLVPASRFKASDVYAFGMVCSEIYTGQVPFARFTRDLQIKARILAGQRPERPVDSSDSWSIWGLTEDMWALMEDCWQHVPEERPTIQEVLDRL